MSRDAKKNNVATIRAKRLYEPYTAAKIFYGLSPAIAGDLALWVRESQSYFSELLLSYLMFNDCGRHYNATDENWHLMECIIKRLIKDSNNKTIMICPIPPVRALSRLPTVHAHCSTRSTTEASLQSEWGLVNGLRQASQIQS
jgi:hypothetical protein